MKSFSWFIVCWIFACGSKVPTQAGGGKEQDDESDDSSGTDPDEVDGELPRADGGDEEGEADATDDGTGDGSDDGEPSNEDAAWSISDPMLITKTNRHSAQMMGGWAPHLRSILTMADGKTWFVAESGTDVNHNTAIVYYRKDEAGWKAVGSVGITGGVQQNIATISDGRLLYSYGIDIQNHYLLECTFDTQAPAINLNTCNAVGYAGTPFTIPDASNYIGAAMASNKRRTVWWTTVGSGGGGGTFSHTFNNAGAGWNGPFTSGIGGYTDTGYVHSAFDAQGSLQMVAQLFLGAYPNGTYHAATAKIVPGQAVAWQLLGDATSTTDIFIDSTSGTIHYLAVRPGGIGYYVLAKGESPKLVKTFANSHRMRFATTADRVVLIHDEAKNDRIVLRSVKMTDAATAIDWDKARSQAVARPTEVTSGEYLNAIWPVDPVKEPAPSNKLQWAVCGDFPANDGTIWYYEAEVE